MKKILKGIGIVYLAMWGIHHLLFEIELALFEAKRMSFGFMMHTCRHINTALELIALGVMIFIYVRKQRVS